MSEVDHEKLRRSLERLEEQYVFFKSNEEMLSGNLKEAVQESVIQRFETCYDTLWKHLKRYFENEGLLHVPGSPNPIFRTAHENGLIENLNDWIDRNDSYSKMRIDTTHDYSMEKAERNLGDKVGNFIQDATELYEQMAEQRMNQRTTT